MEELIRDIPELEIALLRAGVDRRLAGRERCGVCHRTPLVGERVYVYDEALILCELCRSRGPEPPLGSRLVHGPEFGHTMRLTGRRARRTELAGPPRVATGG